MIRFVRIAALVLLFLTAVNALIAGGMFMADPSGALMGMNLSYLRFSPFHSFLIPGIVLFSVNGLLNIYAAIRTIGRRKNYALLIILQGILLGGWIVVQMILVRDINPLHITMLGIGSVMLLCGFMLRKAEAS